MILYLAESNLPPKQLDRLADKAGANNFLFSFAYSQARKSAEHFCIQPYRRVFIDSGAYTTWTKGKKVPLEEYIHFCKQIMGMAKCPVVFAALDVIPGSKNGPDPTKAEIDMAADEGWANYQAMKQEGIAPCLMTYHDLEHRRQLVRIADDSDYFAVAPRKAPLEDSDEGLTELKLQFLKRVFGYIRGREGSLKKIHGFGVSSVPFMEQFPFYSVDSTAWEQSIRSKLYRHLFVRNRRSNWKLKDMNDGETPDIREMVGLLEALGEKSDLNGNSGTYFLHVRGMAGDVLLGRHVTDVWEAKGVTWNDQPRECGHPDQPCDEQPCPRCLEASYRFTQARLGE